MRYQDFQEFWRVEMLVDMKFDESLELRCGVGVDGEVRYS